MEHRRPPNHRRQELGYAFAMQEEAADEVRVEEAADEAWVVQEEAAETADEARVVQA